MPTRDPICRLLCAQQLARGWRLYLLLALSAFALSGCAWVGELFTKTDDPKQMTVEQLYRRAKTALNAQNYSEAIKLYETLESRFPYGLQAQQAILDTAYAHYKLGERAQAVAAADRFIKLYPNHEAVDYAYYIRGLANFIEDLGLLSFIAVQDLSERDQKSAREAFNTFKTLVEKFPNSKYAADARQRMVFLVNALSMNEVHVARYYFNRGAYQAAINRAQASLTTYPNTQANQEALKILIASHRALGNEQLARDAERVYVATYKSLPTEERRPWWRIW
ncbi:MAG: outer membrane protein assembly factor BamD [Casimicrobiaceae bacterium]|nr:outer membrane protein assembly factor BamD [Casimicrobiaceae bacterium]MCX8099419.1 outer membrane protein assembly factor BamD [Casimicrobiaceae bacterium]